MNHATKFYYQVKIIIPRNMQIQLRKNVALRKRRKYLNIWPIDPNSCTKPDTWCGWPENKKFALVLTHDVDTLRGHERCGKLMAIEENLGFRSSFNFVPQRYKVSSSLRDYLVAHSFEIGVHGLYHDGKLYNSYDIFMKRALKINKYLSDWGAVGFRSPAMHHNLEWLQELDIEYDSSTFDTDPFEPQSDGVGTIFPFMVKGREQARCYVELPYTMPQDFTLFIIMGEKDIDIWKQKIAWIASNGGMALINTHPDYMIFEGMPRKSIEEYPIDYYIDLLELIRNKYYGMYWNVLPREVAAFYKRRINHVD